MSEPNILSKILSTGLPFEKYITKRISNLDVYPIEQVPISWIENKNKPTERIHESIIDIDACQHLHLINPYVEQKKQMAIFINFLIECEYRKLPKKWIFFEHITPDRYKEGIEAPEIITSFSKTNTKWSKDVFSDLNKAIRGHLIFLDSLEQVFVRRLFSGLNHILYRFVIKISE